MGKATNFKFGRYIQRVHTKKSPLKIGEKVERGLSKQGLSKFLEHSLLYQEWIKLRTSNLAGMFTGSIRTKALKKFKRKWSVGVLRDCPIFLSTPYYLRKG